jgi:hypothetical protein
LFDVTAILLLSLGPACLAQSVRVRVINGKGGRPLPKQAVSVQFLKEKPASVSPPLRLETDSNGEARFAIPETMAVRLDVRVVTKSEDWHCRCWVMADTETVIHRGIVESAYDQVKPPITVPEAEAGSVVFVLRPYAWWERLIAPLVRQ